MYKKIAFAVIIVVGIFLRTWQIEQVPGGLFGDEVSLAVNAKTIAQNGTDEYGKPYPFGFESFSDYKMPGYIYTSAFVFKFLGPRILSVRLVAVISSIVSIFLIGYLAYLLFPRKKYIGYFAASVLSLSPFAIHFGRIAYETMFATALLLGFFIAFVKSIQGQKRLLWFATGMIFLVSACWTYPAPRFIIPSFLLLIAVAVVIFRPKDWNMQSVFIATSGFLGISALSFIPSFLNPAMEQRPLGYIIPPHTRNIFSFLLGKSMHVVASYLRSFNLEFLFDKGDIFAYRSGTKLQGVFLPALLPFFITGIVVYIKEFGRKEFSFITSGIMLLVCGLPSALTWDVPYGPRFLPMLIPLTILLALGIEYIGRWTTVWKVSLKILGGILFALFLLYNLLSLADSYFVHFAILSQPEFPTATEELGQYLKSHLSQKIYFLDGRSCQSWGYEYLHFWYDADLPNRPMISWNETFRQKRIQTGNPFDAYDFLAYPTGHVGNIVLFPSEQQMAAAPKGALLVHCGIALKDLSPQSEHVEKIFYLYEDIQSDPLFVVSKKL